MAHHDIKRVAPTPKHPRSTQARSHSADDDRLASLHFPVERPGDVLELVESVSRRIDDLARELNCLGYFPDDADRPRAA